MPCGSAKDSNQQEKNAENGHCAFQDLDHSILQHSFSLGVTNVQQILKCIQNGSKEVKDIILNECNIVYECKVCANLFRSLANFLYHKRCYCKKHLCEGMQLFENFEEAETVVVHPEPPDKECDNPPQMTDCTVDLVKANLAEGKSVEVTGEAMDVSHQEPKEKVGKGKGSKLKEPIEDESKKVDKPPRTVSPMISRRTRLKNSLNVSKRPMKSEPEPPKKFTKSLTKASASLKAPTVVEEMVKVSDRSLNERKDQKKAENIKVTESVKINKPAKASEPAKVSELDNVSESNKVCELAKENEPLKGGLPVKEIMKETEVIMLSDSDEEKSENDELAEISENNNAGDPLPAKSSNEMHVKPLKKIIIKKPNSVDLKSSVFDKIGKNMKSNKIGFTSIANASGKNLQCFPKIVFKTIDGNPHAVFQSTDSAKSDSVSLKGKIESSKADSDKLIIVLKKDTNASVTEQKPASGRLLQIAKNQNEFHLTRRKRLLQRSDCNVPELRCLNCKAQFTSLKTLYFHMLSIHSKKRLYYPCPFCKTLFVQMYGVTRHLVSIHNKTKEQINKLRDVIKKKSVWKKVDDVNIKEEIIQNERKPACMIREDPKPASIIKEDPKPASIIKEDPKPEVKVEDPLPTEVSSIKKETTYKSPIKATTDSFLHQCSKCARSFGRKSSQVSHEKFCIMNAIKVETVDLTGGAPISPPPNVSFLSLSPKKVEPVQIQPPIKQQNVQPPKPSDVKVSTRPKRGAEKQMHKDFVDSQTLKWRSANSNSKASTGTIKKPITKTIEKKVLNIMSVEKLQCTKCNKTFSSYSNLRRHAAIHVGWTRFKCKHCEYQAYNKSQCWAHVQKAHAVPEEDLEKSVVSISKNPRKRISSPLSDLKAKRLSLKMNDVPKKKFPKKHASSSVYGEKTEMEKNLPKREANKKDEIQDSKKEVSDPKEKNLNAEHKKELSLKKEKLLPLECKRESIVKKIKIHRIEAKKDVQSAKPTHVQNTVNKKNDSFILKNANEEKCNSSDQKRKSRPLGPIIKFSVPEFRKQGYKSVTTNNPTTIILSKKFSTPTILAKKYPTPTVQQSILTISPESMSSTETVKSFPLRTSPRKSDGKESEELPSLVTRSSAYTKSGSVAIKMPVRSNSTEEQQKSPPVMQEKAYTKKDKLISEWFPKKDLNSNARRESAPLIIGLVPANNTSANPRAKSPAFSCDKSPRAKSPAFSPDKNHN